MDPVFIIAEAGVNHNGSLDIALRMVEVAAKAGADAIKFQTFRADKLVSKVAQKALYQQLETSVDETQLEMLQKLELTSEDHRKLIKHAGYNNIQFLSTPFDIQSIDLLNDLGLGTMKIPSGEITNLPYLRKIARLNKKVILSTGMSTLDEVEKALNLLIAEGTEKEKIIVLHATTEYPAPFDEVNLKAMCTMKNALDIRVGYSDHTTGIEVPVAAVAMGAVVIEKHFTLDRNMSGPDHRASLEPDELVAMVKAIRNVEKALGDGIKKPSEREMGNIKIVRKSIHVAKNIKKGTTLEELDLLALRPGDGISPMFWDKLIGRKLINDVNSLQKLRWEDFE